MNVEKKLEVKNRCYPRTVMYGTEAIGNVEWPLCMGYEQLDKKWANQDRAQQTHGEHENEPDQGLPSP